MMTIDSNFINGRSLLFWILVPIWVSSLWPPRNAFPDAKIHAYEPNQKLSTHLRIHASQANFDVHYEAVGLADGHVSLDFRGDTNQTRSQIDVEGDVPKLLSGKPLSVLEDRLILQKSIVRVQSGNFSKTRNRGRK